MRFHRLAPALCLLAAISLAMPAGAQVYGRPTDPKPGGSGGAASEGALKTVASLTSQNRGTDALAVLSNSVDTGIIASDHVGLMNLNAQDQATIQMMQTGQQMATQQQVIQIVSRYALSRRGDQAVDLYKNALAAGVIKANP